MRIVVASRFDSGSRFLKSYFIILKEMLCNNLPRRLMRLCLNKCHSYTLGRNADLKASWLRILAKHIMELRINAHSFSHFYGFLCDLVYREEYHLSLLNLKDDHTLHSPFKRKPRQIYHVPGDPIIKVTYRGKQSVSLYQHLRKKYPKCTVVYQHDRYHSMRQLCHKGLEKRSAKERLNLFYGMNLSNSN